AVARHLTRLAALSDRVRFEAGDALAMPFADGTFNGAYSINVAMNIADKAAFYREIRRVLVPGGWLVLAESAIGDGRPLDFPTPWARTAATSFLATADQTRAGLLDAGFEVLQLRDSVEAARAFGAPPRALVQRRAQPPQP